MYEQEHPELVKIVGFIELLPHLFEEEVSIAVTNTKVFLKSLPCNLIPLTAEYGDSWPQGSAAFQAIQDKKPVVRDIPDTVYGIPFRSHATPVIVDGEIIGSILIAKNQEKSTKVTMTSQIIASQIMEITQAMQSLQDQNEQLMDINDQISDYVSQSLSNTKDSKEILTMISRIASQTNLLGLNASIEAARVGTVGNGFNVVSKEIGRLSQSTSQSVKKSNEIIKNISESVESIAQTVSNSKEVQNNQIDEFNRIQCSVQEIQAMAEELYQLALTL